MNNNDIKISHLDLQYDVRNEFFEKPILKQLFFELTLNCNEHCWHCGSRCGDVRATEMAPQEWKDILDQIKEDFNGSLPQINVTGGEPLLYPGFEEVMSYAHSLGFKWGMTSNAILITPEVARMLQKCGMNTISVSIDGLPETHDRIRGLQGGYKRAMEGIQNLIDLKCFGSIMVTTVVNHETVRELDSLYEVMCDFDIDSWRIMGIEPIGRALDHPELLLTDDDHRYIMDFIRSKRADNEPVTYGCCHYLGLDYEKEVRDWYFFCMAGVTVASITVTGDVYGCLDIDRNQPGVIQGNIHDRRFSDIWKNEFKAFRRDRAEDNEKCANCKSRKYCMGGAFHTWDLVNKTQRLCLIDALDREKHEQ
ncbi:radical SAM/SPASM domain-containing protein [Butyrivibrio hungatei]|uniref:Radical SAM/SPASM domain-containing protein n=1 Tax=Butyrivibrio hungatei TaxID=185008 RepID=A0A1D9NZK3_9FIRM|nr:radical SAM protein [Butyrivibrio hungatei]AOZ95365.1 radical SAM/SPASM domain-containing protein [Butyrivibrio hungatei]